MAQFQAIIQGTRGEASRLGTKKSGITATARGWNVGVKVYGYHDAETGEDVFQVYRTAGSKARQVPVLIATIREGDPWNVDGAE